MNNLVDIIELDSILKKNIKNESGELVNDSVINYAKLVSTYVSNTPDISNQDINFIRRIVMASKNILESKNQDIQIYRNQLIDLEYRIYEYNIKGASKIHNNSNRIKLKAYFLSDAANTAKNISFKHRDSVGTQSIDWAIKWYDTAKEATELDNSVLNDKQLVYLYTSVSNAAKIISKLNRTKETIKTWCEEIKGAIHISKHIDPSHSVFLHKDLGYALNELYIITKEKKTAEKSIKAYQKFADYFNNNSIAGYNKDIEYVESEIRSLKSQIQKPSGYTHKKRSTNVGVKKYKRLKSNF